jgi:hypothetical protein
MGLAAASLCLLLAVPLHQVICLSVDTPPALRDSIIPASSKYCNHGAQESQAINRRRRVTWPTAAYATFLGYPMVANAEEVEVPLWACMTTFKIRPIARTGKTLAMSGQRKQHLMLPAGPHLPPYKGGHR